MRAYCSAFVSAADLATYPRAGTCSCFALCPPWIRGFGTVDVPTRPKDYMHCGRLPATVYLWGIVEVSSVCPSALGVVALLPGVADAHRGGCGLNARASWSMEAPCQHSVTGG
jgi:hypothetical protein